MGAANPSLTLRALTLRTPDSWLLFLGRREAMVRVGLIGYGYWGPNLVRNFAEASGSEIVAVSDLQPDRLAKVKSRYPAIKTTSDYHDLLDDDSIDAIAIVTPVSTH